MWVSCLGPPRPCRLPILRPNRPPPPIHFPLTVSIIISQPPPYPAVSNNVTVRNDSNSNNTTAEQKQEEGRDISGSDVLWALQRAAAQKKKLKKKKQKEPSPTARHMEKKTVDYSNVKPLQIKREWGVKLDQLEKRLKQLDETP
ncbi:hypothetical protein SLE2022_182140 [Rubroshorea leprosula]